MKFRNVLIGGAALLTFASVPVAASAGAATVSARGSGPHHATVSHARWLGTTRPHAAPSRIIHAAKAGSSGLLGSHPFFSTDGYLNKDLPKNSLGQPPSLATAPVVNGTGPGSTGPVTSTLGLNAHDFAAAHSPSYVAEPPDQGLCAGSGYVLEDVNMVIRAYHSGSLKPASSPLALETFFGTPYAFGVQPLTDYTVQGDVKCLYDRANARWIVSQLFLDLTNNTSKFMIAVSTSSNPVGTYNVYAVDNTDLANPGCPCFGDQPLLGANRNAIFISTNEFSINGPQFNGSVVYALDKNAMEAGSASVNVWSDAVGLNLATPDNACCWYSIQPATSPTNAGGTEYAMSALDFFNAGDTRVAVWAFTNTQSISTTANLGISDTIVGSEAYALPPNGRQKIGPTPLGDCVTASGCGLFAGPTAVPEGPIATNDDRMNQVVFADGKLWSGVNTSVNVKGNLQAGIAYFIVEPRLTGGFVSAHMSSQGYIAPQGQDVLFPSIGVTSEGAGVIAFTLTGPNNYPSSGYAQLYENRIGPVKIAATGQAPQDGFTEYQGYPNIGPRWGDYSAAVADGSQVFFASEMIGHPNCSDSAFLADPTCGGTRDPFANWGTSIGVVRP